MLFRSFSANLLVDACVLRNSLPRSVALFVLPLHPSTPSFFHSLPLSPSPPPSPSLSTPPPPPLHPFPLCFFNFSFFLLLTLFFLLSAVQTCALPILCALYRVFLRRVIGVRGFKSHGSLLTNSQSGHFGRYNSRETGKQ